MKVNTKSIVMEVARNGMTFREVADKAGISVNAFENIRRKGFGSPRSIGKIAQALGVELERIVKEGDRDNGEQ